MERRAHVTLQKPMIDKTAASPAAAVADLRGGATVMTGGIGTAPSGVALVLGPDRTDRN
jgi:acyl CoA:acetate/3-ketoacid CoA transferase alpha subunit